MTNPELTKANNRISGLRHRLKNEGDPAKREALESKLAEAVSVRDEIRGPVKERPKSTSPRPRAAPVPRADRLRELQTLMRRMHFVSEEGDVQPLPVPTINNLIKHAEKYGSDQVVETAAELGYGYDACVRLMDAADRAQMARYKKEHPRGRAPRPGPSESRVREILGISEAA